MIYHNHGTFRTYGTDMKWTEGYIQYINCIHPNTQNKIQVVYPIEVGRKDPL